MTEKTQAAVIGAGPAGSRAASNLAAAGIDVCLLDAKERPGRPVQCGEGIGKLGLESRGFDVKPEWICAATSKALFVSPSGTEVGVENSLGYILDRSVFDYDLALMAGEAGAKHLFGYKAVSAERAGDRWKVKTIHHEKEVVIECTLLIIAEGVEARLTRKLGLCGKINPEDLEICAQYVLENTGIDQDCCYFYTGAKWAPGGYAWAFPKGNGRANVGLGILSVHAKDYSPTKLLKDFVQSHFPDSRVVLKTAGAVPVGMQLKKPYGDGVMVIGDAARQVNCVNGGGLSYCLAAGNMAGQAGARALKAGFVSEKHLKSYVKDWSKWLGKQQKRSYYVKEELLNFKDHELDSIARNLKKKRKGWAPSLLSVFFRVFLKRPSLLWKVVKLFS